MSAPYNRVAVEQGFASSAFIHHLGIALLDCGSGWCEAQMPLRTEHLQHTGVAHAGVVATLADHCAGAAAMTQASAGSRLVTAEFRIHLLRPGRGERLWCRAQVLKPGRTFFVVESEVFALSGEQRVLVAKLSATIASAPA